MRASWRGAKYTIWGKMVASLESGSWWVLLVQSRPWLVLAPKVLQHYANQLVGWFCASSYEWIVAYHSSESHPGVPTRPSTLLKCWDPGSVPRAPNIFVVLSFRLILSLPRSLGARQWHYMDVTMIIFPIFFRYKIKIKIKFIEIF
jgi:hypothetical protein